MFFLKEKSFFMIFREKKKTFLWLEEDFWMFKSIFLEKIVWKKMFFSERKEFFMIFLGKKKLFYD